MDGNKLQDILARSQSLILNEEFDKRVNSHKGSTKYGSGSSPDLADLEAIAFNSSPSTDGGMIMESYSPKAVSAPNLETSKLPKAILDSFKKQPPIQIQEDSAVGMSEIERATKNLSLNNSKSLNENVIPRQTVQSGTIDYSLIKTIIDESVRKHLSEMKDSLLTESATPQLRGMRIGDGNKIQLLDSKGNLYEGVLKLKSKAK